MWSYWITDTFTGERLAPFEPETGTARTVANGFGRGRHVWNLHDTDHRYSQSMIDRLTRPWANTVTVCWDDAIFYDGFLIDTDWDEDSGRLVMSSSELRVIMKSRYQYFIYTHDPAGSFAVAGKSLRGIASAIIRRAMRAAPPGDWDLPVVIDADEGGGESRDWPAWRFMSMEQMLTEIQDTDGGPDVHFQPRWNAQGRREWVARIGSPRLAGPVVETHARAPEGGALNVRERVDGAKQITGVWMQGEGGERDMPIGRAGGMAGTRIPNLDLPRPFKTTRDVSVLDARAWGALRADREATRQVTHNVLADRALPQMTVGSTSRVWIDGSPKIPDGWHQGYVIGMNATVGSSLIGLEFQ